jgi:hypothetical protein
MGGRTDWQASGQGRLGKRGGDRGREETEEIEEESEVTDGEDDEQFNENAVEKLLARASDSDAFSEQTTLRYTLIVNRQKSKCFFVLQQPFFVFRLEHAVSQPKRIKNL